VSIYNLEKSNDTFRLQKAQEKIKILNEKIKVLTEENNRSFWNKLFKRKK
jgi:septation ring formation regulator EzrA